MTLTYIQDHSSMRNQNCSVHFLRNIIVNLDIIQYVTITCWFVGACARCVCTSTVQGREVCWCDLIKYMISIVLYLDSSELICFKLSIVVDTIILHSWIPALMTLMFTQGHRVMRKLEVM